MVFDTQIDTDRVNLIQIDIDVLDTDRVNPIQIYTEYLIPRYIQIDSS